jgi:3'5'-cyclic nucleotide phosphodiesterase
VAEQNSVDLAWDLLMDEEEFGALQQCVFPTEAEIKRFRQVVVNVVMATDIFDRELCDMRDNRWAKAFAEREPGAMPDEDDENRKATIVIEHIMQASDVSHAMQHWCVYQRWNRRLFDELFTAYRANRMERDPSDFWYESELKFFDSYIIPLAKKLKDCGVFGVSSDECLNYAMDNRREWESKGQMIVDELVSNYQQREREEAEAQASAAVNGNGNGNGTAKKSRRTRMARRRSLFTSGG